jgi:hypothetical protein
LYQSTKYMLLAGVIGLSIIAGTAIADTETVGKFFQWVDKNGAIAFTNIDRRIPVAFRPSVVVREFSELPKETIIAVPAETYRKILHDRLDHVIHSKRSR